MGVESMSTSQEVVGSCIFFRETFSWIEKQRSKEKFNPTLKDEVVIFRSWSTLIIIAKTTPAYISDEISLIWKKLLTQN